jgi:glutaredoxin
MFCNRTKEFLRKNNVAFTDRDITRDEAALAELEKLEPAPTCGSDQTDSSAVA